MKKILLVLVMLAGIVFMGQPALAAEGDGVVDETATSSTPAEVAPAAGDEAAAEPAAADEPAPADEPAGSDPAEGASPEAEAPTAAPADGSDATEPADQADTAPPVEPAAEPVAEKAVAQQQAIGAAAVVKVEICHATASRTNPYVQNAPNASGTLNGHTGHTGPLYVVGGPAGWGDIIPPFTFNGTTYPGMNWPSGKAIFDNGCNIPGQVVVPLIQATAVAPTATAPTCTVPGALVLPTTVGVIYSSTPAGSGPGTYTVTASAEVGYVLTNPLFEATITVLPQRADAACVVNGLLPATAVLPTLNPPTCQAAGSFALPNTPGVFYLDLNIGAVHVVTAFPRRGYFLTNPFLVVARIFVVQPELRGPQCDSTNITICHRTNSNVKPYVAIGPSTAGIANGHDTQHEGPVWDPTLKDRKIEWGDIIPPYTYMDVDYPGQNWGAAGQAIFANGCTPAAGLSLPVTPAVTTVALCDGGLRPTPTVVPGVSYAFTTGDGVKGPWEITATALTGFEIVAPTQFVFTGNAGNEASCLAPAVTTVPTCDSGVSPVPTPVTGVSYQYTVGDGVTGPWSITATVQNGFFLKTGAQTVFSGNAGNPASVACTGTGGGTNDPGAGSGGGGGDDNGGGSGGGDTPVVFTKTPLGTLPNTGGTPLWMLLLGGSLTAAGVIILMGNRRVLHAYSSGSGPLYSLGLPPVKVAPVATVSAVSVGGLRGVLASVVTGVRRLMGRRA